MATVLCISSFVARGHVGLSAIVPALNGLGHETISLPTVLLSNHPGHPAFSKHDVPADIIGDTIDTYQRAGWLPGIDAVLTGYLPTRQHVEAAAHAIDCVRQHNAKALIVCDPVSGDDPGGLYISEDAACALRGDLLPRASVITPNRFEIEWLSQQPVTTQAEAISAARATGVKAVLVTSLPINSKSAGNLLIEAQDTALAAVPLLRLVPHGTGDFLAALFTGHVLNGHAHSQALQLAAAGVHAVALRSQDLEELRIVAERDAWTAPAVTANSACKL